MSREKALEHKALGNKEFSCGNFEVAAEHFSDAINEDPTDHVFYSNRSGCYASLQKYEEAEEDGKKCVTLKSDWAKGYTRLGLAQFFLKKYDEAEATYKKGLTLAPEDKALKEGLDKVITAKMNAKINAQSGAAGGDGIDMSRLMTAMQKNPKIAQYVQDKDLMEKFNLLMQVQKNPDAMKQNPQFLQSMMSDQRLLELMLAMQGLDMSDMPGQEEPFEHERKADEERKKKAAAGSSTTGMKKPKVEEKPDERSPEQKAGDALKDEGNALYKAKKFDEAIAKYDEAIAVMPNDLIYYNNKAAVLLEQSKWDECETLLKDVLERKYEINTNNPGGASFEKVGKVLNRLGSCYQKQNKYKEALDSYNKSLAEDNNKNTRNAIRECEREKIKYEKELYMDPEKAEIHKQKGNELFKNSKWVEAKIEYDEAIKRNPNDAKLYSNRAACFQKLMAHPDALRDLEEAIKLDPKFVKAYSRKGFSHMLMKDYNKSLNAYDKGLSIDPNDEGCKQGKQQVQTKIQMTAMGYTDDGNGGYTKGNGKGNGGKGGGAEPDQQQINEAMKDPEIQAILRDPQMNLLLKEMSENPKAAQDMISKDPQVANAVQKLMAAGILRMG